MKRRYFSLIGAIVLLITSFCGCSSDKNSVGLLEKGKTYTGRSGELVVSVDKSDADTWTLTNIDRDPATNYTIAKVEYTGETIADYQIIKITAQKMVGDIKIDGYATEDGEEYVYTQDGNTIVLIEVRNALRESLESGTIEEFLENHLPALKIVPKEN